MSIQNAVPIFVSYSHSDRYSAETLAEQLREVGYAPWIDFNGIVGGTEWRQSIDIALRESTACVVLLTPDSTQSEFVKYEIKRAKEIGCSIVPLLIRTCDIPLELEPLQFIDFRQDSKGAFKSLQQALLFAVARTANTKKQIHLKSQQQALIDQPETLSIKAEKPIEKVIKPLALVIEDVQQYQELVRDILVDVGIEVHTAATRSRAVDLLRSNRYAFITLDMQLGIDDIAGQEGFFILDMLRRYQVNTPIVIISRLEWDKNRTRDFFVRYGIKDMLDKPFDQNVLRDIVNKYVQS